MRRLADLLYVRVEAAGLTLRRVDRRLGWRRDYLSQLLRGCPKLRVSHLYAVLEALGLPPWRFFRELYGPLVRNPRGGAGSDGGRRSSAEAGEKPLPDGAAGEEWRVGRDSPGDTPATGEPSESRLVSAASRLQGLLEGRRLTGQGAAGPARPSRAHLRRSRWTALVAHRSRRLTLLLRLSLRASGLSRAEVSRRLGRGPHYLGRLLRRDPDLSLEQFCALLAALGVPPAAFFHRLHPLPASERRNPRLSTPAPDTSDRTRTD